MCEWIGDSDTLHSASASGPAVTFCRFWPAPVHPELDDARHVPLERVEDVSAGRVDVVMVYAATYATSAVKPPGNIRWYATFQERSWPL